MATTVPVPAQARLLVRVPVPPRQALSWGLLTNSAKPEPPANISKQKQVMGMLDQPVPVQKVQKAQSPDKRKRPVHGDSGLLRELAQRPKYSHNPYIEDPNANAALAAHEEEIAEYEYEYEYECGRATHLHAPYLADSQAPGPLSPGSRVLVDQ